MSTVLERRLSKLEEALRPAPVQAFCLLAEPERDAVPKAWDEFLQQVKEAKVRGDFVGILSASQRGERRHYVKGAEYFAGEFEALLARAGRSRSERGNANRLADIIEDASGNVFGPVACETVRQRRAARSVRASGCPPEDSAGHPSRELSPAAHPKAADGA